MLQGVAMTRKLLLEAVARHGLTPVGTAGEAFTPELHEAVGFDAEADVEAEQSAGGTGLGAGDPADDGGAAGTEAPADDAADASGQGAAGASGAEGGASR